MVWYERSLDSTHVCRVQVNYEQLAEQCQKFAVELLDQTRNMSELNTILNYDNATTDTPSRSDAQGSHGNGDNEGMEGRSEDIPRLVRLKVAIKYKQKQVSQEWFLPLYWYRSWLLTKYVVYFTTYPSGAHVSGGDNWGADFILSLAGMYQMFFAFLYDSREYGKSLVNHSTHKWDSTFVLAKWKWNH